MKERKEEQIDAGNGGFTLIEVLLVVAILGILAGVAVVQFGGRTEGAQINATRTSIGALSMAVDLYEVDQGTYPSGIVDLTVPHGDIAPYIRGGEPTDPWGNLYQFERSGGSFVITSAGPDGQFGSEDDITSPTSE